MTILEIVLMAILVYLVIGYIVSHITEEHSKESILVILFYIPLLIRKYFWVIRNKIRKDKEATK